jgi:hypothetical protein
MVLIGNELFPTWGGNGAAPPPELRPRLVVRLSPQSAKNLADVLTNFVANYEQAYGELRTDYLLRKHRPELLDDSFRSTFPSSVLH